MLKYEELLNKEQRFPKEKLQVGDSVTVTLSPPDTKVPSRRMRVSSHPVTVVFQRSSARLSVEKGLGESFLVVILL